MRNIWIGLIVVIAAIALGVAAAWSAVALYQNRVAVLTNDGSGVPSPGLRSYGGCQGPFSQQRFQPNQCSPSWDQRGSSTFPKPGARPGVSWNMPGPMMRPWENSYEQANGERINLEQAVSKAETYLSGLRNSEDLKVLEVMEFEANFYIVVVEKDTARGAFELLVDPYSGAVSPEPGPNMMWNQKYGHMRSKALDGQNTISFTEAKEIAQEALGRQKPGAEIEGMGLEFYGYFTFDYEIDGQIAGMLSVNGASGNVWFHTWHGEFIAEKEF